jgi:hypothetical protein
MTKGGEDVLKDLPACGCAGQWLDRQPHLGRCAVVATAARCATPRGESDSERYAANRPTYPQHLITASC